MHSETAESPPSDYGSVARLITSPPRDWDSVLKSQSVPKFDERDSPTPPDIPELPACSSSSHLRAHSPLCTQGTIGVMHCVWKSTSGPTPLFTWYDINMKSEGIFAQEVTQSVCALMKDPMTLGSCVRVNAQRIEISHRFECISPLDVQTVSDEPHLTIPTTNSKTAHGVCAYIKIHSKRDTRHVLRCAPELRKQAVALASLFQKLSTDALNNADKAHNSNHVTVNMSEYQQMLFKFGFTLRACLCCNISTGGMNFNSELAKDFCKPQVSQEKYGQQVSFHASLLKFALYIILCRKKRFIVRSNFPIRAIELFDFVKAVLPSSIHNWCCRLPLNEVLPDVLLQATTVSMQEVKLTLVEGEYVFDVDTSKLYVKEGTSLRQVAIENHLADRFCKNAGISDMVRSAKETSSRNHQLYIYNLWRISTRFHSAILAAWMSHSKSAASQLMHLMTRKTSPIISEFLLRYSEKEFSYVRFKFKQDQAQKNLADLVKNFI